MAAKSKRKGKSGERVICKIFESTFGGSWQRVFSSGAFIGGANAVRKEFLSDGQIKNAKADIVPPDEFNIVIESKSYQDFPWHKLIQQDPILLLDAWLDEVFACIDEDDFWLLCVKIDYKGWFVLFDTKFEPFTYKNHAKYVSSKHSKTFIITASLENFLIENKNYILTLITK
ncbi:MAG: hypothetical protein HC836_26235 [Richelia sp. RM2_1_2]|nr:hypothetical protein [Richelia sp. RM2_1_2]